MKQHNYKVNQTRYPKLGYLKLDANIWRFCDLSDRTPEQLPMTVGYTYRTKTELLSDLDRYAKEVWNY